LPSHGAISAGIESAFKESKNAIEIVRLSLCCHQPAATSALDPSCHGETRSPCPFRSIAEARVLNLVAGSTVQLPEFATGYGHVWRLVGKNCNPFC
jgi:hypothetical protein